MSETALRLHGYWRSSATYRVRIALNLKGLSFETVSHDLRKNEQLDPAYRALGVQGLVPVLESPSGPMLQSIAIIEWLNDRWPEPPLLPADPDTRATVRAMAAIVACDIHPLQNLRVLRALRHDFAADPDAVQDWARRWIVEGFFALEGLIERHGRGLAFGDRPSLADCVLVPQVYNAESFGVSLEPFPAIRAAAEAARALPAFENARPEIQLGASVPVI